MSDPFLSEVRMMSFNYAPKGWAQCNGQRLPINQNQALFALLATTFGGNGQTDFALPDLRGQVPIHVGNGHALGEKSGQQNVTLTLGQLPTHLHSASANNIAPTSGGPNTRMLSQSSGANLFGTASNLQPMNANAIGTAGGNQPHINMQPFLTINFCIALQGIFPSPN